METTTRQNQMSQSINTSVVSNSATGSSSDAQTDERLISMIRQGDHNAFDALIKRYERQIYNLAYRLAGNYDDAQEVVSEAFVRICLNLHTVQHAITLKAWINRIVVNVYINLRRRAKRRPASSLEALQEKAGDAILDRANQNAVAPDEQAEAKELKMILNRAVASLPEFQRKLVTLFHHEGRTYEEIASALRIPIGTVKSRLNRARLALRESLTPYQAVVLH